MSDAVGDVRPASPFAADRPGYFGHYGGAFVPETLRPALCEVETAFARLRDDPKFVAELRQLLATFVGRPTALQSAEALSRRVGARVYLKREDLAHTGAHKINNALGQALLARRLGKTRIIAETGAGQHGVAVAAVSAKLGLDCTVYMGVDDMLRQAPNVRRMRLFGANLVPVERGCRTLKSAINEAIRDWLGSSSSSHYLLGSAVGPHPYPAMVRHFQTVIGEECEAQLDMLALRPTVLVACVGGGSNSIGLFAPFIDDPSVRLIGVEAGGRGTATGDHSIRLAQQISNVAVGVMQGCKSLVIQNYEGQIMSTHSVAPGLDYVMIGPEHAYLRDIGRVDYISANDEEALDAWRLLAREEGIVCALESAHAIAGLFIVADRLGPDDVVVVNLSGRGDKDLDACEGNDKA